MAAAVFSAVYFDHFEVASGAFFFYMDYRTLPIVYKDAAGECVKVENLENGHAFNCNDVDVTLRRYRQPVK